MLGRAPDSIQGLRPLRHGVIADFDTTERMLKYFITTVHRRRRLVHPRIVLTVPTGITQVEKGGPGLGAASGRPGGVPDRAGDGRRPRGRTPDPGARRPHGGGHWGGTTEVAILSLAGIVYSKSVRIAGDEMDEAIIQHLRRTHGLLIGERQAEEVKIALGSAYPEGGEDQKRDVKGRDLIDGFPKTLVVTGAEVREALRDPVMAVVNAVQACLELAPPELAADIVDKGIVLTGGGALLRGLDRLLHGRLISRSRLATIRSPVSLTALASCSTNSPCSGE
jgi:rod shape-determining protein MreB and related proteins